MPYTSVIAGMALNPKATFAKNAERVIAPSWGVDQVGVLSSFAAGQPVVTMAGLASLTRLGRPEPVYHLFGQSLAGHFRLLSKRSSKPVSMKEQYQK